MPFDTAIVVARLDPLAEALERRGLRPVDAATLSAHKQAQLRRYGPNFWFRHQGLLLLAMLSPFVGIAVASGFGAETAGSSLPCYIGFGGLCALSLVLVSGAVRLRSGSHWEERWVPATALDRLGVPEAIATVARRLQRDVPGSALILGELMQDKVVLDPYLLLARGRERVCLGVWDGAEIIAVAE